jgi:D-lactate dehydrogenase (cytochrome)
MNKILDKLACDLEEIFGSRFSHNKSICEQHGKDESSHPVSPPDMVVYPLSTQEVSQTVKRCAQDKVPVIAFGAGTALEGQVNAVQGGVCIDLSRMNKVINISPDDQSVTIEAGITREALNHELRTTGLHFPVDPGANATLGGMAATGASGTTTVRYGAMQANVLAATAVMADGSIVKLGSHARKTSAGYDLLNLLIGSEGTLGIFTELTVRIHGRPEATATGVYAFENLETMVDAVSAAIQSGLGVARLELLDEMAIAGINKYAGLHLMVAPTLITEFHGTPASIEADTACFKDIADMSGCLDVRMETGIEGQAKIWRARHAVFYASKMENPNRYGLITDVCVPISKLAQSIKDARADFKKHGIEPAFVGHVGDGNYHTIIWVDPDDLASIKTAKGIVHRMGERAISVGGTCTGEHGIGMGKIDLLAIEHETSLPFMRVIKQALDPNNILNPGKLFE